MANTNPQPLSKPTTAPSFKEAHREMQELVRELLLLRRHNLRFKQGDPQDRILMFAEGALCIIAFERFLRIILAGSAKDKDTLQNLLEMASGGKSPKVTLADRKKTIEDIVGFRNSLLHANFEQVAAKAGRGSVREYFRRQFARDLERVSMLLNDALKQIDPATGERRS